MRIALVTLLAAACAPLIPGAGEEPTFRADIELDLPIPDDADFVPGRIIVGFHGPADVAALPLPQAPDLGTLTRLRDWQELDAALYALPDDADVIDAVEQLRATGAYLYVEPDYRRYALVDDTYRSYQWNFDAVDAESAWAYSTGSGATVAVLDTGVTSGSSDGIGNLATGYDYVNNDTDASDDNGHGSHVAGTIGAATDNTAGVAGLAYDATILPVKVLDQNGSGSVADIVSGMNYAVSQGADVINMSIGGVSYAASEATAVANAYSSGLFIAAASGNSGASSVEYPGGYTGAVAVGATDYNDTRTSYSNYGTALDLMAPGGDVTADDNGDGFADGIVQETFDPTWGFYFWEGTSMASPHVAAAAALLMANGATNAEAETYLADNATDMGSTGWDSSTGYGLIQPAAALAAWEADNGDTGDTGGTSCATTITLSDYTASTGSLETTATATSSSETLTVYADTNLLGTLTWDSGDSQFEETWTWPVAPDDITVQSDCGDSDTDPVTVN